jgi:hypothetical protein
MAQAFPNAFAVDQPEGSSRQSPYAADAFIEPWLLKHSEFYRKHLTKDGRHESKAGRRASQITVESRKNSIEATQPTPGAVAAAENASERGAESIEEERLQQKAEESKETKKGWRRHLHL